MRRAVPAAGAAGGEGVKARGLYDNELLDHIGRAASALGSAAAAAAAGAQAAGLSGVRARLELEAGCAQLLGTLRPGGRAIQREPPRAGQPRGAQPAPR